MYELYIKDASNVWQLADLGTEKPAINIQRNDIGELKDRQTDYSQAVKLPKTPTNCRIFSFIDEFTTVSDLRHKRIDCHLIVDGYTIVGNGAYLKFVSIVENYFNIQIIGSLASFFTKLQALNDDDNQITLNDLTFTEVINRSYSGFVASNPANNRDSFFAIADYYKGTGSRTGSMNKETYAIGQAYQYPFVKFKSIIDKILSDNGGYTLESDILSDLEYTNSCIPFDGLKPDANSLSGATFVGNPFAVSAPGETIMKAVASRDEIGEFTASISGYFEYSDGTYTCKFKVPTDGTYSFLFKMEGSTSGISALMVYYDETKEGAVGAWNGSESTEISLNVSKSFPVTNVDYINFQLILEAPGTIARNLTLTSFSIELQSIKIATGSKAAVGINMPIKTNLPDITQEDFFKSFLQLFGLTVDVDVDSGTMRAYTLNQVIKNKANAPDWSAKYSKGSGTVKFTLGSYAQTNSIEYKEYNNSIDSSSAYTEVSEGLAEYMHNNQFVVYYTNTDGGETTQLNPSETFVRDQLEYYVIGIVLDDDDLNIKSKGYIKVDDETLEKTYTLFDPIFKAAENNTILYGTTNRYRYAKLKRIDTTSDTFDTGDDPTLLLFRHTADINVIDDDKNVLGSANLYFVSSQSPAINAGEEEITLEAQHFISKYYPGLTTNVLADARVIEDAEIYLTPKDIWEYDPFTPVYIDTFGAYFYVNKIKNFVSGKLTKCDLVRI